MPTATQLIRRDHKKVDGLFGRFERSKKREAKQRICDLVAHELELHTALEEEIFYPAIKKYVGEEETLQEAEQEHQQAKDMISDLKSLNAEEGQFEKKFLDLVEAVRQHVQEEEGELLPKVEESEMDLLEIGEQMAERKEELLEEMQPGDAQKLQHKTGTGRKARANSARRPRRAA